MAKIRIAEGIKGLEDIRDAQFEKLSPEVQSSLQDLSESLKEVTYGLQGWCYKYYPQTLFGKAIYEDFVAYNGSDKTFKFSDDFAESGVLSQLEGFQFIAMLAEDFGLNPKVYGDKIRELLDSILDSIVDKEGNLLRLDASPYLKDSSLFSNGDYYVDSMTWFMSMACSVIRLVKKDNGFEIGAEREKRLFAAFHQCMKYLTDHFIDGGEPNNKFVSGWNYTGNKDITSPSLYFTFAVSEVLIDIFTTFESTIRGYETKLVQEEIENRLADEPEADQESILAKQRQIQDNNDAFISEVPLKELEDEKRCFAGVNDGKDAFAEGSLYGILENQCKIAARNIWAIVKDKLTDEFFAPNVTSTVSAETIEQSITSDALFNNIFIINILMNAGLDEDKEDEINYFSIGGTARYLNALSEYDEMRSIMRLGYDRVYQMYTKMKKANKDYKVNDYTLSFTEDFVGETLIAQTQELRRAHIRVFSLMPLLVKTKTTMSDFVIRYPQFDMQLYLETILDNRFVGKDGKKKWIWEKDGYSSSSNYYFLSALNDFYGYYNEYELKYSENAYKNDKEKEKIQDDYFKVLETKGHEIYNLRQDLENANSRNEELSQRNEQLNADLAEQKANPIYKALTDFVTKTIQDNIKDIVSNLFGQMAVSISEDGKERAKRHHAGDDSGTPEKGAFENSVNDLLFALLKEDMTTALFQDKAITESNIDRKMNVMTDRTSADLRKLLRLYLYQVYIAGDGGEGSDFVATKGYAGIKDVLKDAEERKAQQKDKKN